MAAATLAVHRIVKEAVDVGVGLCSLNKAFKNSLQRGASHPQAEATQVQQDSGDLRGDMKAAGQAIEKVIDNQASLLVLVFQGPARICSGGPDALQVEIEKGFASVLQSVQDVSAIWAARELKTKMGQAALACNRMVDEIVATTEHQPRQLTPSVMWDIEDAERSAAELHIWASSFVPRNPGAMTKQQSKLQTMPYIVAMAYAARVQAIAHILKRDMMEYECDQITCLKRARKVVDDFMAVLDRALEGIMADTSLLEVTMVYRLPLAMVLTFITSFRASMDEQLQLPGVRDREMVVWDDGLALIRDVVHFKASGADGDEEYTINFESYDEEMWWLAFTDTDLAVTGMSKRRTSIRFRELCHVLGGQHYDRRIALIPGRKRALLQLPPASALRAALCANIAHARGAAHAHRPAPPPPPPPPTFAATHAPPLAAVASHALTGHTKAVNFVAVCPDDERVVSASDDNTARVWSLSSGQHLRTLSGHTDSLFCVAVSPDARTAVSGSWDKSVRVWSVESGIAQHTLQGHSAGVWAVAVSPDGRSIASGSCDCTVRLWNAESGQCLATLTGHSRLVSCVAFSPDGETLVSGSFDTGIRVWNVRTRAIQRTLKGHSGYVNGVAVTPDGRRVVSGSNDGTVKVWSLSSGAEEMSLEERCEEVRCVAVFPDGQRIASGSWNRNVRVWNVRSQALEVTLEVHSWGVTSVAVSSDGRSVVSGNDDGTITVWALSSGGWGRAIQSNDPQAGVQRGRRDDELERGKRMEIER